MKTHNYPGFIPTPGETYLYRYDLFNTVPVTVGRNLHKRISDTDDQMTKIKVYTEATTEDGKTIIVWVERLFPLS